MIVTHDPDIARHGRRSPWHGVCPCGADVVIGTKDAARAWKAEHAYEARRFADVNGNIIEKGDVVYALPNFPGPELWKSTPSRPIGLVVVDRGRATVFVTLPGSKVRCPAPGHTLEIARKGNA